MTKSWQRENASFSYSVLGTDNREDVYKLSAKDYWKTVLDSKMFVVNHVFHILKVVFLC